jgi:hypothetical protein
MPKTHKCCPSSKSHNRSCVEKCVKECKEVYCRAKYEKLAAKLLRTGLIQDSCNYSADRNLDTIAGAKWNWLNNFLIANSGFNPTAAYLDPTAVANLAPASYGSVNAFQSVDPTLSNFVFALEYTEANLLNATLTGAGQGVPLVQDILQDYYGVGLGTLTTPPGTATPPVFGVANLTAINNFATPTGAFNGYPELATYTQAYIAAMQQIIAQLPVNQAIVGATGIPLIVDVTYTVNNASNVSVNQVARVGIIQVSSGSSFSTAVTSTISTLPAIGVPIGTVGATTITAPATTYIIYGYGRNVCPDLLPPPPQGRPGGPGRPGM